MYTASTDPHRDDFMRWEVALMASPDYWNAESELNERIRHEEYRVAKAWAHAYDRLRTLLPDVFDEYLREELER